MGGRGGVAVGNGGASRGERLAPGGEPLILYCLAWISGSQPSWSLSDTTGDHEVYMFFSAMVARVTASVKSSSGSDDLLQRREGAAGGSR